MRNDFPSQTPIFPEFYIIIFVLWFKGDFFKHNVHFDEKIWWNNDFITFAT